MMHTVYSKISLVILLSTTQCLITSDAAPNKKFKVLSFNIDTNIGRTEEGYARDSHAEWRVQSRIPLLHKALFNIHKQHQPDVIHLQEGRKFITKFGDEVDSITPLVDYLKHLGYQVLTQPYNPSDRAFSYITAVHPKYDILGTELLYLTKTPDRPTDHTNHQDRIAEIKDHNFGEEWERCIFITQIKDAQGRMYRLKNVHLGIVEEARKKACELIVNDSKKAALINPQIREVTTGDFNTFPDWGGPEQIQIMTQDNVVQEVTKDLRLSNGQKIDWSFIAFLADFAANEKRLITECRKKHNKPLHAYLEELQPLVRRDAIDEIYANECQALGGKLDRVFQQGFTHAQATLLLTPTYSDLDETNVTEDVVKKYVMRHSKQGPAFASDHQPVLTELTLE